MKITKPILRSVALALVAVATSLSVTGCKCTKGEPAKSGEHPAKSEHPEHPK